MILPPGTHWRLVNSVRKIHPASPSCAPSQTTTAPQFPDCTPPSETCPSCPGTVHRPPYAATAASAGGPRNALSTVDRCPVPCSPPDPSAAPPAAPRRSHRTPPPRPQTVCCTATCWATAAPFPLSLRTPGNPPDTVPPPPWFDTQSTADPGSPVHTPRASCAPVFRSPHRSCCDSPACA